MNQGWSGGTAAESARRILSGRAFSNSTGLNWDELRIGDGFLDVCPQPKVDIEIVTPTVNEVFHDVGQPLSFKVTSSVATVPSSGITLTLNGVNVSSGLGFSAIAGGWEVTYSGMLSNVQYTATAYATNLLGDNNSLTWKFDTMSLSNITVDAEDHNYNGGQFADAAGPNGYSGQNGIAGIDYSDSTAGNLGLQYRNDDVDIYTSVDMTRPDFSAVSSTDYQVGNLSRSEWLNYTRTIPPGAHQVYLRASTGSRQSVRLDLVTSDRTQANQTTVPLGVFDVTGAYAYAPLKDAVGNNVVLSGLSGLNTLRLSSIAADNNLNLNFFTFVPVAPVSLPPYVAASTPANNQQNALGNTSIQATIMNRTTTVDTGSIALSVDGTAVTPVITPIAQGATVSYTPPTVFASGSSHTVRLVFNDSAATSFTNQWTFKVVTYSAIPTDYAAAISSGATPGFNLKVVKARNDATNITANVARAEQQLAGLLIDPLTGSAYVNEALDGGITTSTTINFARPGKMPGYFTSNVDPGYSDSDFPAIDFNAAPDPNYFSMQAISYIPLTAGFHLLGVRSDDGFRLTVGPVPADTNLVVCIFDGGRGDGPTEGYVYAPVDGLYAFRLVYLESTGDESLEFYYTDLATGQRYLFNDPVFTSAKAAYQTGGMPAAPVVVWVSPANGANNVSLSPAIMASIDNTAATVQTGSFQLQIDGLPVNLTPTVTNTALGVFVAYPAGQLALANNTLHTAALSFTDSAGKTKTNTWSFTSLVPEIKSITTSGNNVTISWIGGGTLQYQTNVTATPWLSLSGSPGNSPYTDTNAKTNAARYYRVKK